MKFDFIPTPRKYSCIGLELLRHFLARHDQDRLVSYTVNQNNNVTTYCSLAAI